jgi:hypothetical protein
VRHRYYHPALGSWTTRDPLFDHWEGQMVESGGGEDTTADNVEAVHRSASGGTGCGGCAGGDERESSHRAGSRSIFSEARVEEIARLSLYRMLVNDPMNRVDALGLRCPDGYRLIREYWVDEGRPTTTRGDPVVVSEREWTEDRWTWCEIQQRGCNPQQAPLLLKFRCVERIWSTAITTKQLRVQWMYCERIKGSGDLRMPTGKKDWKIIKTDRATRKETECSPVDYDNACRIA